MSLFWDLLGQGVGVAEQIDERVEAVRDVKHATEAVVGRGILTERFIGRGHGAITRLKERAEDGNPPGLVNTASEIWEFLAGDE